MIQQETLECPRCGNPVPPYQDEELCNMCVEELEARWDAHHKTYCADCGFEIAPEEEHPLSNDELHYCLRCGQKRVQREHLVQCEKCKEWVATTHWGICQDCYCED